MTIAVQVTDNSAARIVDNIGRAADDGADLAVIAPPYFGMAYASPRETARRLENLYLEAVGRSSLPVGIYDRGSYSAVVIPERVLARVYLEPKVRVVKDSSVIASHLVLAIKAREKRPELTLFCGYEFDCVKYLRAGYDGLLLGGGAFNGYLANMILKAMADGDEKDRASLPGKDEPPHVHGLWREEDHGLAVGREIPPREAGLFGTYRNFPDYPLTDGEKAAIDKIAEREKAFLLP